MKHLGSVVCLTSFRTFFRFHSFFFFPVMFICRCSHLISVLLECEEIVGVLGFWIPFYLILHFVFLKSLQYHVPSLLDSCANTDRVSSGYTVRRDGRPSQANMYCVEPSTVEYIHRLIFSPRRVQCHLSEYSPTPVDVHLLHLAFLVRQP